MKVFAGTLSTKKAAATVEFAYAVEIMAATPVRITTWSSALTIDGETYTPNMPIEIGRISSSGGGSDGGSIKLGNVDETFSSYFFDGGFKRKKITVREVFPETSTESEILFIGEVDSQQLDNTWLRLGLGAIVNQSSARTPRRRLVAACGFIFKSTDCNYSGATTHCPKTFNGCLSGRYAGFRFIPAKGASFVWAKQKLVIT